MALGFGAGWSTPEPDLCIVCKASLEALVTLCVVPGPRPKLAPLYDASAAPAAATAGANPVRLSLFGFRKCQGQHGFFEAAAQSARMVLI